MGWLVHCRPNPPSVNSKQPDIGVWRSRLTKRAGMKIGASSQLFVQTILIFSFSG
jgi:hypothetical protein